MAVIEMVDTKILVACSVPIDLHRKGNRPIGQYLVRISTSVSGIVTRHSNKSTREWNERKWKRELKSKSRFEHNI